MLTWKLWRALNRPPQRSPVYQRAYASQQSPSDPHSVRLPLLSLIKYLSQVVLPVVLILVGVPMVILLYYIALLISPLLLPLANTLYGLMHANSASGSIARERDRRTYDVICTSPGGTLGMHWSYCTGWLHYHNKYRYALLGILSIGIVASVFGLAAQVVFGTDPALTQSPVPLSIVRGLALGTLFVFDFGQTIVISSLLSLLVPAYVENEGSTRMWASSLFLVLQIGVYLPTILIGISALPSAFWLLGLDPMIAAILTPLLSVAFFALLREMIIAGLWNQVTERLSTTAVELDAITRAAV